MLIKWILSSDFGEVAAVCLKVTYTTITLMVNINGSCGTANASPLPPVGADLRLKYSNKLPHSHRGLSQRNAPLFRS